MQIKVEMFDIFHYIQYDANLSRNVIYISLYLV